ncbi:MAG: alanine racemase [Bdellovibrionota bacterium]
MRAPEIRLDLEALKANFEWLSRSPDPARAHLPLMPVVKADAYGHGAVIIARCLESAFDEKRMPFLCVARWSEAEELRKAGVRRSILVLSQFSSEEISSKPLADISLLVATPQDLKILEKIGASARAALRGVHVHFNTGMNRLGFPHAILNAELEAVLSSLVEMSLKIEGFSTHLARSEEDPEVFTETQVARFDAVLATVDSVWKKSWGAFPALVHAANSAGLLRRLGSRMTAGRPGLFLWGVHQDTETLQRLGKEFPDLKLRPVLGMRCSLREVFWVEKGEGVSYGHRYVAPSRRLVGILNFGYADGLARSLSREDGDPAPLKFWIEGEAAPILGTVTMDMVLVDLTDHSRGAQILAKMHSSESVIWAEWIGGAQPVELHASALGTISYEILCDLSRRVKREPLDA